jgi:hypothetical protein
MATSGAIGGIAGNRRLGLKGGTYSFFFLAKRWLSWPLFKTLNN